MKSFRVFTLEKNGTGFVTPLLHAQKTVCPLGTFWDIADSIVCKKLAKFFFNVNLSGLSLNLTDASDWFRTGQDDGLIYKYFEYFIEQDAQEWADIELYALAERDWQAMRGIRPEVAASKTEKNGVGGAVLSQFEVAEFTGSALDNLMSTEEDIRILKNSLASFREEVRSSDRMLALEKLEEIKHLERKIAREVGRVRNKADDVQRQVMKRIEAGGFESVDELNPFARRRYDYHRQCLNNLSIGMANIFE